MFQALAPLGCQAETKFGIKVYENNATASALFRSADSDAAFSMSQRLGGLLSSPAARVGGCARLIADPILLFFPGVRHARPPAKRFKKQIFLSVDVPPEVYSSGRGPAVLLEVEKGVVEQLRGL